MKRIDVEKYENMKLSFDFVLYRKKKIVNIEWKGKSFEELVLEVYGISGKFGVSDLILWVKTSEDILNTIGYDKIMNGYKMILIDRMSTEDALKIRNSVNNVEDFFKVYEKGMRKSEFFVPL